MRGPDPFTAAALCFSWCCRCYRQHQETAAVAFLDRAIERHYQPAGTPGEALSRCAGPGNGRSLKKL